MLYLHRYTVQGSFNFPTDMLRYDSSYPADSESVSQMGLSDNRDYQKVYHDEHGKNPVFVIKLIHRADSKAWRPTEGRWNSFGWRIVDNPAPQKV